MYTFWFNDMRLPVTPGKLTIKIKGRNKTLTLANGGDINFLRTPGLTEISFEFLLPMLSGYSVAPSHRRPDYYLTELKRFLISKKPFRFIVSRSAPYGGALFDTNMRVSLESYTISEDASKGTDITVSVSLKQYSEYGTKLIVLGDSSGTATVQKQERERDNAPQGKAYTVKAGDCLWLIAKQFYGDGSQYMKIREANGLDSNLIHPGQVLNIP